jgi:hypothetical protein
MGDPTVGILHRSEFEDSLDLNGPCDVGKQGLRSPEKVNLDRVGGQIIRETVFPFVHLQGNGGEKERVGGGSRLADHVTRHADPAAGEAFRLFRELQTAGPRGSMKQLPHPERNGCLGSRTFERSRRGGAPRTVCQGGGSGECSREIGQQEKRDGETGGLQMENTLDLRRGDWVEGF